MLIVQYSAIIKVIVFWLLILYCIIHHAVLTYFFSTITMVARTHLIVTLYSYCLPCITLYSLRGTSSNLNSNVALILVPKLSPVISREIYGGESGARSDFSPSSQAVICQYHCTVAAEFCCYQQDPWARPGKFLMTMVFRNWRSGQWTTA
jgi:hypothetical protein